MKAAIIVFSPSGHTLAAARMIQRSIEEKGGITDIVNVTKDDSLLAASKSERQNMLKNRLKEFDVLFAGTPVYAGHAETHVLRILEALPEPDQKRSKIAVPFITYGGAHSFIALEEMGRALKKKKYVPVLGIKLASFHTLSRFFRTKILEHKPGDAEERLIEKAISTILDLCLHTEHIQDNSSSFAYTKVPMRLMLNILSQEKIHAKFKTVSIIRENCHACKKCISVCPVNNFIFADGKVSIKDQKNCILCGECFYHCKSNAIDFAYRTVAQKRLNDGNIILEKDLSVVYPKRYGYINNEGELCYE